MKKKLFTKADLQHIQSELEFAEQIRLSNYRKSKSLREANKARLSEREKKTKIIAIDPGENGGIAIYSTELSSVTDVIKMPSTPQDVLLYLTVNKENTICYLEKVGGMPGQGGSAMFNFGKGYGHLEMALLALQIPTVTITPQSWQKALQLGTRGKDMSKTEWKNKLKAKAQQLFPYIKKITLATSDALLICEYARIKEKL